MHSVNPIEFDNRFNLRNRVFWISFVGGTIFWILFWVHCYGLGNFLPIKIGNLEENTLEENLTALIYAISFLIALGLFFLTPGLRLRFGLFGLYSLLMLGEETDWGQVYLHFPSPGFFAHYNKLGVTNIHNLQAAGYLFTVFVFLVPIGAFVIYHYKKWKRKKILLSAVICWAMVAALVSELFPDRTIFNFMLSWMVLSYLFLMAHLRFFKTAQKVE